MKIIYFSKAIRIKKTAAIIITIMMLWSCNQPYKPKIDKESEIVQKYKTELEEILFLDQKYRLLSDTLEQIYEWDSDTLQKIYGIEHVQDSLNLIEIERIIGEIGWPKNSVYGDYASDAAFLVLQHCGKLTIMEKYLPIMIEAANNKELAWSSLALFIDRIKMKKGEKQIYGTQIIFNDSQQKLMVYPIENTQNIDSLRKSVGLIPISKYLESYGIKNIE